LEKTTSMLDELSDAQKQVTALRQRLVSAEFEDKLHKPIQVKDVNIIVARLNEADAETLRQMIDRFRLQYPEKGIAVLASVNDERPTIISGTTTDLLARGINAVELVKFIAAPLGGGGGGKPTLAQAGGKDASQLDSALQSVEIWVKKELDS
jgi:alanyl-tRNA synthetase